MSGGKELDEVLGSLPHGREFRFIDSLEDFVPGNSGAASYRLRPEEPFLAGHFPGAPEMPGVLMIEAVAQLGGVIAQSDPEIEPFARLRLAAVRQAKILGSVKPGEVLRIEARVAGRMGPIVQVEGSIRCGEREVLRTSVSLSGA